MRILKTLGLLFAAFLMCNTSLTASDYFIQNNLEQAKQQAAQEGKLIFVDFWAEWCNPCKWMDEQTFSNPQVKDYLSKEYISVRVDIDNFQGYNLKEEYNIRYLPTLLVLNEQGELIKKYEESFAPSKLISLLKELNKGRQNKQHYATNYNDGYHAVNPIQQQQPSTKPAPTWEPALSSDYGSNTTANNNTSYPTTQSEPAYTNQAAATSYNEPTSNYNQAATSYNKPSTYQAPAASTTTSTYKPVTPGSYNAPSRATHASSASTTTGGYSNVGLYQFNVYPAPNSGYSIQVGAFYEYGNVLREVQVLQEKFQEVIYVHISELNGMPCYKVLLGHYGVRQSADQFKVDLKNQGLDCFIKDLASMGQTMEDSYTSN